MSKWLRMVIVFLSLGCFCSAMAKNQGPLETAKDLTNSILSDLEKIDVPPGPKRDQLIYNLIDQKAVPSFALEEMAKAVVGRPAWQKATSTTQKKFVSAFKHYVINMYLAALNSYDGQQTMNFFPIRGQYTDCALINSSLKLSNGSLIQIQYNMKQEKNRWVIYDFSVDGVSLVKNYNAQFAGTIRSEGLEGLIKQIKARNER